MTAVVLAGGGTGDALARAHGALCKALVPVGGKPMAAHVLAALTACDSVSRVVYVGERFGGLDLCNVDVVPPGLGYSQSLALGLGAALALDPAAPLLVVTADVPWLTPQAIDRFVTASAGAQLAYPIVSAQAALRDFPGQRRTFVKLRQGRYTGGNLLLLHPSLTAPFLALIERAYRARKNPAALATLVGPRTLLAFITGRAEIPTLERIVGQRLGGVVRAVVSEDACLAADVDRPEHLVDAPPGIERVAPD